MYKINANEFGLGVLGQIFAHDFQTIQLKFLLMSKKNLSMVCSFLFSYTSWSVNGKQMISHPSCIQEKVLKMKQSATIFIPISGDISDN